MKESNQLKTHIFVCTNSKDNGASCGARGATSLREQLKAECAKEFSDFKGQFRVNASGCLGQCERGIAAVIYPESQWFLDLKKDDINLLKEKIKESLEK